MVSSRYKRQVVLEQRGGMGDRASLKPQGKHRTNNNAEKLLAKPLKTDRAHPVNNSSSTEDEYVIVRSTVV